MTSFRRLHAATCVVVLAAAATAFAPSAAAQPAPASGPPPAATPVPAPTPAPPPGTPAVVPAAGPDDETEAARLHFEKGQGLFVNKQFHEAAEEFKAAYAKKPAPTFLYNAGVCYEKLADYTGAISYFRRYLAESPDARDKEKVLTRIQSDIDASNGKGSDQSKKVEELPGMLDIQSNPTGATIYLDDKVSGPLGVTPWTGPMHGDHTLIIESKGYKSATDKISVQNGHYVQGRYALSQDTNLGWVEVRANIAGADVFLDDKTAGAIGRTPYQSNVVVGKHKVIISKEGFTEETHDIDVEGGKVYKVEANLDKAAIGFIHVTGVGVEGAKVKLDGKVVCEQAPCRFQSPDGNHTLEVERPGLKTFTRSMTIMKATDTELSVKMQPIQSKLDVIWNFAFAAVFIGGGVGLGLEANSVKSGIQSDITKGMPPVSPEDSRFLKGKLFYYGADALYVIGGITAITGVVSLLKEKGPSSSGTAETKDLSVLPVVGPNYAGMTAEVRW